MLIWPAAWNLYPIVFADTGTYLSQALRGYLGWDRPVFYSLFMAALHLRIATWPVVAAQALLTLLVLDQTGRALGVARVWLLPVTAILAAMSWLPWLVSELMPDVFTPLLVLTLSALLFAPERFSPRERAAMVAMAAFMIATQQSSVALSAAFVGFLLAARWVAAWTGRRGAAAARVHGDSAQWRGGTMLAVVPIVLAITAMITVNAIGFGRVSVSPFGNVFLLARVIYDGPGMTVLRRECPDAGWRLCPFLDRFPATSDEFLWSADSPVILAGGHKAISAEADPIVRAALRAEPLRAARAAIANAIEQFGRFESGDGLEAWDGKVEPWIARYFPPRERAAFAAARQQRGALAVPAWLKDLHRFAAMAGILAAAVLLPVAVRRHRRAAWLLAASLSVLPLSAAITGALSTPHDRYQSRIVWLPACVALLSGIALRRRPEIISEAPLLDPRHDLAASKPALARHPRLRRCGQRRRRWPSLAGHDDDSAGLRTTATDPGVSHPGPVASP